MPTSPILLVFVPAIVLIVIGRIYHGRRWGNWVALAGYVLLAVAVVIAIASRR